MSEDLPDLGEEHPLFGLMEGLDKYREALRGCVAGVVADGFTSEQAHALVTHMWCGYRSEKDDEEDEK